MWLLLLKFLEEIKKVGAINTKTIPLFRIISLAAATKYNSSIWLLNYVISITIISRSDDRISSPLNIKSTLPAGT